MGEDLEGGRVVKAPEFRRLLVRSRRSAEGTSSRVGAMTPSAAFAEHTAQCARGKVVSENITSNRERVEAIVRYVRGDPIDACGRKFLRVSLEGLGKADEYQRP